MSPAEALAIAASLYLAPPPVLEVQPEEMPAYAFRPGAEVTQAMRDYVVEHVKAVYDRDERRIIVTPGLPGDGLVHEMVHYLQDVTGAQAECFRALEVDAYRVQDQYRASLGLPPWLDAMTVAHLSSCHDPE